MQILVVATSSSLRLLAAGLLAFAIVGCSTITHKQTVGTPEDKVPQHIAIFFDGTHNDEASDTNIKRLHSLVSLQGRPDLSTLYIEGVGTRADIAGMATGYGIGERVRIAYDFLLKHHRPGDKVYLFGFSRGAYAARVLNSLLYHAGLPAKPDNLTHSELAETVYKLVKVESDYPAQYEPLRRQRVQEELLTHKLGPAPAVEVQVLGLWDTVEALGAPNWLSRISHKAQIQQHLADVDNANSRYGDKLCNVHHAFHAMSIDDNREWIFTPQLLTRRHLFAGCSPAERPPILDEHGNVRLDRLREVWFAGAHSDVGGGYADSRMSGVSLNWMLEEMHKAKVDLVPTGTKVPEDRFGTSHNPEAGAFSPIYHSINRDLVAYVRSDASLVNRLCVHPSVFERRKFVPVRSHENSQLELRRPGRACLKMAAPQLNSLDARGRLTQFLETKDQCPPGTAAILDVRKDPDC
ncbi:DUF2235 domain-containing protein [Polaromonas sp.]|uniref:phospholipase effector Tle1 domain-containing protein n=1 Tax=Polaromonas sp. TaxID=1869339 RepID=UPI002488C0C8|nr:DUF2235 domain-containing protein [Polaromonas sp.]MDI1273304.1 DUF2235 domain-containing protein [Polaromonas sp.]